MRGGAFLNGKEGRVGFRKKPFLMGKSDANECNESSLSNCRVQLALSPKKDGMIITLPFTHLTSLLWVNEGLRKCKPRIASHHTNSWPSKNFLGYMYIQI